MGSIRERALSLTSPVSLENRLQKNRGIEHRTEYFQLNLFLNIISIIRPQGLELKLR